jgi:hypothetical protein
MGIRCLGGAPGVSGVHDHDIGGNSSGCPVVQSQVVIDRVWARLGAGREMLSG